MFSHRTLSTQMAPEETEQKEHDGTGDFLAMIAMMQELGHREITGGGGTLKPKQLSIRLWKAKSKI